MRRPHRITGATVPVADLRSRLSLSIPETMRLTGYGRIRVEGLIHQDEVRWFIEGSSKRIETASLIEYQDRRISSAKAS